MSLPTKPCRFCGRPISLVRTVKGHAMPVDPVPNDDGNVLVTVDDGVVRAHVIGKAQPALIGTLFMPHFATCPNYRPTRRRRNQR